jgi:hypothetical protein
MSHPMPNLKWYVIFWNEPDAEILVNEPGDLLARFDIASQFGHLTGRKIKGMWIIRQGDKDDVLRVYGIVPAEISWRFYAARRHQAR